MNGQGSLAPTALPTTVVSLHLVFAHHSPFRNDGLRSSCICKTKLNGMNLNIKTTQNFSRTAGSSQRFSV